MDTIWINDVEYFIHDFFNDYGCSIDGSVIRISSNKRPRQKYEMYNGNMEFVVYLWYRGILHRYLKKRFLFETFNECKLNRDDKIKEIDGKCHNLNIFNLYIE